MIRIPRYLGWSLVAASGYGACSFFAHRSIYYPMRYPEGLYHSAGELGVEDVWLTTSDRVKLHAWWLAVPGARLATLHLHGNAGNISHRLAAAREIAGAGSSLLLLDYRGYGRSEGWPSESGLYRDATAGYEHLIRAGIPPERIVIHGESLGSAVAVELAARRPCGGVVLEAPFTSARDVAGRVLPIAGPLLISGFDSRSRIDRVQANLLVIHGDRDEVIDFSMGCELFDRASTRKWFWRVEGAGHNDIVFVAGPKYRESLRAFYATRAAQ